MLIFFYKFFITKKLSKLSFDNSVLCKKLALTYPINKKLAEY